ncbi:UDP-N-acetylmuramoyl-L-alanyl-D-glutamate--2,6-diaminopimelate ligase [Gorillibacterium massiliense]|uniref:UDP-N-acetylmuramoyl-L-alanyl-D-glutamate--2, 6-diaminopimelate ligase n=1 Tax=Gorillibacterium massiliense TaxID=1280390 RepID=UPI0004AF14F0|nr:UDP-N-acetylmuramoyl-L-alanyl-D-glutamate--2,6-diaminopimelate ligase [Gorillibacterium massiliense]
MQLNELAALIPFARLQGDGAVEIGGVQTDSRKVKPGDLFICLPGYQQDGHEYAQAAVANGAAALVVQRETGQNVPTLYVRDSRMAMAVIGNHFFGYPSGEMSVIGITGTNGKTTTAHIIERILTDYGKSCGLMGTIGIKIGGELLPSNNTTLESLELQMTFRSMRDAGADYCVMEVSSHALDMGRVKGVRFRSAIFTNLTQDHLDYHKSMEDYQAAKGLLFSRLGNEFYADPAKRQYAILNADDPASETYAKLTAAYTVTYGIDKEADVRAENIRVTVQGTEFRLTTFAGDADVRLKLVGKFNVYNTLAAIAAALLEGIRFSSILSTIENMAIVEGRLETVNEGQDFLVVVDYSHTPDSLENVLTTIKEFAGKRVITVFGCGGDRDRTKRPIMGGIAATYSDYILATSDNPRTEDPLAILEEIKPGIIAAGANSDRYELISDRRAAIEKAVEMAASGDVILIAGKGHETYQDIGGVKHHFDDREEARKAIRRKLG